MKLTKLQVVTLFLVALAGTIIGLRATGAVSTRAAGKGSKDPKPSAGQPYLSRQVGSDSRSPYQLLTHSGAGVCT